MAARVSSYAQRTDAHLLESVGLHADCAAFAELFARYAPRLLGYFTRHARRRSNAEDLVQDVMLRVWVNAAVYRAELGTPSAWIFRIARNRKVDLYRRQGHARFDDPELLGSCPSELAGPDEQCARRRTRERAARALAALSPAHAELVCASYFDEETSAQISFRLALPQGTVKSRLAKALMTMRGNMEMRQR